MENIIIEYYILNDNMSDEEFDSAEEKQFILTEDMVLAIMEQHVPFDRDKGDYIDKQNLYVNRN